MSSINNLIGWLLILIITIAGLWIVITARDHIYKPAIKPENIPNHIHKFSLRDDK